MRAAVQARRRLLPHLASLTAAFLATSVARAYQAEVHASSAFQLYVVQSPFGSPELSRQRLTHTLALDVDDLGAPMGRRGPWFLVRVQLRLDGDYGIGPEERDPGQSSRFVPGLETSQVDLAYGYVQSGGLLGGVGGFTLGRQVVVNELGWWSFDGAKISLIPTQLVELAAYAGYEQRGGTGWLSTSRYEADGVYRGDRSGLDSRTWPGYLSSRSPAPAVGVSLDVLAASWIRARVDYRRVVQRDRVVTSPFAGSDGTVPTIKKTRISSERAGAAASASFGDWGQADGALVYDRYRALISEQRLSLAFDPSSRLRMGLAYDYFVPTFDADSVFNWFGASRSIALRTNGEWRFSRYLTLGAYGGSRWLGVADLRYIEAWQSQAAGQDWFGGLEADWVEGGSFFRIANDVEVGDAGDRLVTDLEYRQRLAGDWLETLTETSLATWRDPSMAADGDTSFAYVLGARLNPLGSPQLQLEWEHALSRALAQRFRVMASLQTRLP